MTMKRQPGVKFESAAWIINIHHVLIAQNFLSLMNASSSTISCQRSLRLSFGPIERPVFKRSKKSVFRPTQRIWPSRNFNRLNESEGRRDRPTTYPIRALLRRSLLVHLNDNLSFTPFPFFQDISKNHLDPANPVRYDPPSLHNMA